MKIIAYADPSCPYCARLNQLDSQYRLGIEFRLTNHPSYVSDSKKHSYKKLPLVVTSEGTLIGGYVECANNITQLMSL